MAGPRPARRSIPAVEAAALRLPLSEPSGWQPAGQVECSWAVTGTAAADCSQRKGAVPEVHVRFLISSRVLMAETGAGAQW